MYEQVFQTPGSMSKWFQDVLQISDRSVRTALDQLESCCFIVGRKPKKLTVNPKLAHKYHVLPGQIQKLIVDAPCTLSGLELIQKVNTMRNYNYKLSVHEVDQAAMRFAEDAITSERIRRLENETCSLKERVESLQKTVDFLTSRASNEDAMAARAIMRLVKP